MTAVVAYGMYQELLSDPSLSFAISVAAAAFADCTGIEIGPTNAVIFALLLMFAGESVTLN